MKLMDSNDHHPMEEETWYRHLPQDLYEHVLSFVPPPLLALVNKTYYQAYEQWQQETVGSTVDWLLLKKYIHVRSMMKLYQTQLRNCRRRIRQWKEEVEEAQEEDETLEDHYRCILQQEHHHAVSLARILNRLNEQKLRFGKKCKESKRLLLLRNSHRQGYLSIGR